jgi:hypothetical protein
VTESEHFEVVLHELACFLLDLGDLASRVLLIGGQVLALESLRRRGTALLEVQTETGIALNRGFTMEPDLLLDLDEDTFQSERLTEVLRLRGYQRTREFRWARRIDVNSEWVTIEMDLFAPPQVPRDVLPTRMTRLPDAGLALRRPRRIDVSVGGAPLRISVPDAAAFLAMKVRAKCEQRPTESKDCFDMFAYVTLVGTTEVRASLTEAGEIGEWVRKKLVEIFYDTKASGVEDVAQFAVGLSPDEEALLRQGVVDLFADLA